MAIIIHKGILKLDNYLVIGSDSWYAKSDAQILLILVFFFQVCSDMKRRVCRQGNACGEGEGGGRGRRERGVGEAG